MKIVNILPAQNPIRPKITMPGSKSYTNRALFLAALSQNPVKILNPLVSDDTKAMIGCLKKLGIKILVKKNCFEVLNNITSIKNRSYNLDANESGTTLRFMLALSTIIPGIKTLYGKEGLNKRPIEELVKTLQKAGADIKYLEKYGYPPVQISSSKLNPKTIRLSGSISSQYISAILMLAPLLGEVKIEVSGNQISKLYIDMTLDIMKQFGVIVVNKNYKKYAISPNQKCSVKKYSVEGDLSSACYFFAIAVLTKSTITVKNIKSQTKQADIKFLQILEKMGNKIAYGKNQITLAGQGAKPVKVNMQDFPDQVQTLAVLTAFANGTTKISGISSLRYKETDRIYALKQELKKMGIKTSSTKNILTIYGGKPKAARINTYGDHRMAMSFAVAGAKLTGMEITDPDVVNKTFPDFWEKLKALGINITEEKKSFKKIVLIGFMGAGKSSVAAKLAKKLNLSHIEMDELILKKSRQKTINDIFKIDGENTFRNLEMQVAQLLEKKNNIVISAGGGVIMNQKTMKYLKENAVVILLDTLFKTVKKRLAETTDRPLWNGSKEAGILYKLRMPLYEKYADIIVTTDDKPIGRVVEEILVKI